MAMKSYNGWSGFVRGERYKQYTYLRNNGFFVKQDCCQMCGDPVRKGFGHHAEEYGDTVEDYLRNCYYLCAGCHGLLHVRFQFPNRWNRYRFTIKSGVPRKQVVHMGEVYGRVKNMVDIPYFKPVKLGNWSDDLTCLWNTDEKIPKKLVLDDETGELVKVNEDWEGIDFLDLGLTFDFNLMGTGHDKDKE